MSEKLLIFKNDYFSYAWICKNKRAQFYKMSLMLVKIKYNKYMIIKLLIKNEFFYKKKMNMQKSNDTILWNQYNVIVKLEKIK
jgi:hypothetical protein